MNSSYFCDQNNVRYQLVQSNGGVAYNWLFFPGGPGADSSYFKSLTDELRLPGNTWLIDLPFNGSNVLDNQDNFDFDEWYDYFVSTISKFSNPIYVGHSFGGMFPLLFPELEEILKGFVILNSAPSVWMAEAAKMAEEKNLPILTGPMEEFTNNPNTDTFKNALMACLPYYFPPHSLEQGKAFIENMITNFHAAVWWIKKANETNFNATWIPQNLPTLILMGEEDCICPASIFENDKRFQRDNIFQIKIKDAGHAPWLEKMSDVKEAFKRIIAKI